MEEKGIKKWLLMRGFFADCRTCASRKRDCHKDCQFYQGVNMYDQKAKADKGKPQLRLVPTEIINCIARVREYGNAKYGSSENWKTVEKERYIDAMFRHLLAYIMDNAGVDEESGLPHLWHLACNVAFLCEMEKEK